MRNITRLLALGLAASLSLSGCGKRDAAAPASAPSPEPVPVMAPAAPPAGAAAAAGDDAPAKKPMASGGRAMGGKYKAKQRFADSLDADGVAGGLAEKADKNAKDEAKNEDKKSEGGRGDNEPPTRAWFPETFLFEPLVVTDETGQRTVPVRVPDRLTSWRVLALAHSRAGSQAGATTKFLGTLPLYVDPVVPPFLRTGDLVKLPIQVVNTTQTAAQATLTVEPKGVESDLTQTALTVPAAGSQVALATLRAPRPGKAQLRVRAGEADAVLRTFEVQPTGKPVVEKRSGTLAAPRSLSIETAANADAETHRLRVLVFPGALALLRSELAVSLGRGGVADDAYALFLAGRATQLLAQLGDHADPEAVRNVRIVAGQRVLRAARTYEPVHGPELAEAALQHAAESPILGRLGERLLASLAQSQRPDGTCGGGAGWSLQRVLVTTAECARAVRAGVPAPGTPEAKTPAADNGRRRAQAVGIRASGAFERLLDRVDDPYTAAALLASGQVVGSGRDKLRELIVKAVKATPDGARRVTVPRGVVRPDGDPAGELEATALAVLALDDGGARGDRALLADLGATLLGGYSPGRGWGDGRTNLVCLLAILRLFKDPLPSSVKVTVSLDGKPLAEGQLDKQRVREVLALEAAAPGATGKHTFEVKAEPAVPGLGYSLQLTSYVPWEKGPTDQGVELEVTPPAELQVGQPALLKLRAVAPAGRQLVIRQSLPAGVQVDANALTQLQAGSRISRFETSPGLVELWVPALSPGQTLSLELRVIPTLAGTLQTSASTIEVVSGATASAAAPAVSLASTSPADAPPRLFQVPPTTWSIK
jgi:hypothetical protein